MVWIAVVVVIAVSPLSRVSCVWAIEIEVVHSVVFSVELAGCLMMIIVNLCLRQGLSVGFPSGGSVATAISTRLMLLLL